MKSLTSSWIGLAFTVALGGAAESASFLDPVGHPYPAQAKAVHEAEHAVDDAWEIYHQAALGGTVASPLMQADIEEHLHEARTLVSQAHEAARLGDRRQVERLVDRIKLHTTGAIAGSRERKR